MRAWRTHLARLLTGMPIRWATAVQPKQGRVQIKKEIALLDWMHSEIDLIEADLPSKRTIAANSSDY